MQVRYILLNYNCSSDNYVNCYFFPFQEMQICIFTFHETVFAVLGILVIMSVKSWRICKCETETDQTWQSKITIKLMLMIVLSMASICWYKVHALLLICIIWTSCLHTMTRTFSELFGELLLKYEMRVMSCEYDRDTYVL